MVSVRRSADRGHFNQGWLDTYHTFSFGQYYEPTMQGYRSLRVINEDRVQPRKGFDTHPHKNMEIITYVLKGRLEHKDSLGNGSVIYPGEIQRMSAGTGIEHSEYNPSKSNECHLLQIWIVPTMPGLVPSYEQKKLSAKDTPNVWTLLGSQDGKNGSVRIAQKVQFWGLYLEAGKSAIVPLSKERYAWLQIATGSLKLRKLELFAGDGAAIREELGLTVEAIADCEVLLFDLA